MSPNWRACHPQEKIFPPMMHVKMSLTFQLPVKTHSLKVYETFIIKTIPRDTRNPIVGFQKSAFADRHPQKFCLPKYLLDHFQNKLITCNTAVQNNFDFQPCEKTLTPWHHMNVSQQ